MLSGFALRVDAMPVLLVDQYPFRLSTPAFPSGLLPV